MEISFVFIIIVNSSFNDVIQTNNNEYVIAGSFSGSSNKLLVRIDSLGNYNSNLASIFL